MRVRDAFVRICCARKVMWKVPLNAASLHGIQGLRRGLLWRTDKDMQDLV